MSKRSKNGARLLIPDKQPEPPDHQHFSNEFMEESKAPKDIEGGHPHPIPHVTQSQELPKTRGSGHFQNAEVSRLSQLNSGIEKLSVSILEMKQKCKDLDMEEVLFRKRSPKKQDEIRQFLSAKKVQKIDLTNKRKSRLQKQSKSLQQQINFQVQQKKKKQRQAIMESLNKIQQLKAQRQEQKKTKAQKEKKIIQMYNRIQEQQKRHPKFHIRALQQQKKHQKIKQIEQQEILQKRKQIYKPLQLQQLQQHTQKYVRMLEQFGNMKKLQREEEKNKILEENRKFQDVYRGRNYYQAVQEVQSRIRNRKSPLLRKKKIEDYDQYVRDNFGPTNNAKLQEIQKGGKKVGESNQREVKRYRFYRGKSYGEITQSLPIPKTQGQKRKIGNDYMQFLKSLPKRKDPVPTPIQPSLLQPQKTNPFSKPAAIPRRIKKSPQIKLSDQPTRDELGMLMDQLKMKDEDICKKEKIMRMASNSTSTTGTVNHKILGDQLVFNIQRKLSLLAKL